MKIVTGYFGKSVGQRTWSSGVHLVDESTELPLCNYKPAKSMKFLWCAKYVNLEMVTCKKCLKNYSGTFK